MTTHVVTITPDATLKEIEALFARYHFHHVVVAENHKALGIISDRDLVRARSPYVGTAAEQTRDAVTMHRKAHQIMSRKLITAHPTTLAADAALVLVRNAIGSLPVLDDCGILLGLVTWRDLLRWAVKDLAPPKPECDGGDCCSGGCKAA
jgi:acetoin utilization protein AcuB